MKPELEDTLDVWDMQLAEYGSKVIKRRKQFIKDINKIIKPIHRKLTENSEEIEVVYKKSCNEDELYNKIIENRKKDIKLKVRQQVHIEMIFYFLTKILILEPMAVRDRKELLLCRLSWRK